MEKKKKINLASFGAGITAGGMVLVAGALPPLFKAEEGSLLRLLICLAIVCVGLTIHKNMKKRNVE